MPRVFLATVVLLAVSLPGYAQDEKTKPNTLTPKEIADGWILLFDGETTFGWEAEWSPRGTTPKVTDGTLDLTTKACYINGTTRFSEFELHFEYFLERGEGANVGVQYREGNTMYSFPSSTPLRTQSKWTPAWVKSVSGEVEFSWHREKQRCSRASAVRFASADEASLRLRNIKLRPLNTKSLFNGKDLTGWREFPGKKSTFTVTDAAINVKNGPGDLQTVGKYQDFILQLECKSNGKYLNSGIFFRCRDNEYQNGYEAQIFNKFTPEATQDYTIEEYDPKTNKLLAKNKIKSTAVDFGTGAIYRRVPARKEMSKDGEWFGMTIVVHGNHLATWVNGVQVTDWHDNRPKSDNARTGCKLEAGHLSIQGHDPTTDLSFKNFRLTELK